MGVASTTLQRWIPEPIYERTHTQPSLFLSVVWLILLIAVIVGSQISGNTLSIPYVIFLIICLVCCVVSTALEIVLYYYIKDLKSRSPVTPQSYMEMTNTEMRIHSDDPIRRDALNYDINTLEKTRQQFESVQQRCIYIDESDFLTLDTYAFQVLLPSVLSCGIIIMIRLLAITHFATIPVQLNFGPKSDGSYDNICFYQGDVNSYGHWIQGLLAGSLLFPAIKGNITRCIRSDTWDRHALLFLEIVASCMTIYSSYNFIKRLVRSSDVFATSSFSNNGLEWIIGVTVGTCVGMVITSMYKYYTIITNPNYLISMRMKTDISSLPLKGKIVLLGIRIPKGLLLLMTAYSCGLMIAISWNTCENDAEDCINYSPNNPNGWLITAMILIPLSINLFFKLYYYYRGPPSEE